MKPAASVELLGTGDAPLPEIRRLLDAAFDGDFGDDDWNHALGGRHAVASVDGSVVAHAAVVARRLVVGREPGSSFATGYVEAVAVLPGRQGQGLGTKVMREIERLIRRDFALGALGAAVPEFYDRLGWLRWQGPTYVEGPGGRQRTPADDGAVFVLPVGDEPPDVAQDLTCDWRAGDVW